MVTTTRGFGSKDPESLCTSDDGIRRIVVDEVSATIKDTILDMFGSIKTTMVELFYERYAFVNEAAASIAIATVAAARTHDGDSILYREFNNMKPPEFDGVKDLIDAIRWVFDVEG